MSFKPSSVTYYLSSSGPDQSCISMRERMARRQEGAAEQGLPKPGLLSVVRRIHRDTWNCTPSAAALLPFEIKLKHEDIFPQCWLPLGILKTITMFSEYTKELDFVISVWVYASLLKSIEFPCTFFSRRLKHNGRRQWTAFMSMW